MNRTTIIEDEYATLMYYPDENILHHRFHRFIFGKKFRDFLTRGAEIIEENQCQKYLSDDRFNSALHPDDMEWANIHYRPRVVKAGLKYWALVMPRKVFGKATMKQAAELNRKEGVNVQEFNNPSEAMEWLESI